MARKAGYGIHRSHRSGETEIRSSPTCCAPWARSNQDWLGIRTDRVAKYNQLCAYGEELGPR